MKKTLQHIRNRVLAGIVFLIPLFVLVIIIQKLWTKLTGAGNYFARLVGLDSVLGSNSVPVATAVIMIVLFYLFGWLVKFSQLNRTKDWIENSVLQYIPGYLTYKAQLQERISPSDDKRVPVLVNTVLGSRPGLLVEEKANNAIVFFPNSPDSNNGQVLIVEKQQITRLDTNVAGLMKSLQKFGKDLAATKA